MPQVDDDVHVLVVDDDEGMAVTLRDVLDSMGYAVEIAFPGSEALQRVRERRPDCILMDIKMPGMTGVDAYREIKRLSLDSATIFMTAYTRSSLVEKAHREGAIAVLTKPLDPEQVLSLIEETAGMTPVLIVDDDVSFCRSLASALAARAFDVRTAQTTRQAIELFERKPSRIVILDRKFEEGGDLDVFRLMREIDPRAIVIPMAALSDLEESSHGIPTPDSPDCLEKPFEIEDLVGRIKQALELRQRSHQSDSPPGLPINTKGAQ